MGVRTYTSLEIILSDDCSLDSTFAIMQLMTKSYAGPHRIILNRNPRNLGIGAHVNAVAALARGELIVLAAGDDVSHPLRTQTLFNVWKALDYKTVLLYSNVFSMDALSNVMPDSDDMIHRGVLSIENILNGHIPILGATTAVSRQVFTSFPPIDAAVIHEDRVLPLRVLLLGGVLKRVDERLVYYRVLGGVSQWTKGSLKENLYSVFKRTLPDAEQRLHDLLYLVPFQKKWIKESKKNIVNQKIRIKMCQSNGVSLEFQVIKSLYVAAYSSYLLSLYLRFRFPKLIMAIKRARDYLSNNNCSRI
jgi:glycosyltransferase involved in cell wall biosynthesis